MLMGAHIVNEPDPGKMLLPKCCAKDVLFYGLVVVAAAGTVAGSMMTVRVEVEVRPAPSVAT